MAGGASQYMQAQMLNWVFGGAAVTKPTIWAIGLSLGTPNSTSGSEVTIAGYARSTVTWAAAGTPTGSGTVTNANAISFSMTSTATLVGFQIWDTILASNSGHMLAWGTLSAASVVPPASGASFASGALTVVLS